MRANSNGLRLSITKSWEHKILSSSSYFNSTKQIFLIQNYLKSFFRALPRMNEKWVELEKFLFFESLNSSTIILFFNNPFLLLSSRPQKKFFFLYFSDQFRFFWSKLSSLLERDLIRLLKSNINLLFINNTKPNIFFISSFIISSLQNRFKLNRCVSTSKRFLTTYVGFSIVCSGRLDRKERASVFKSSMGALSFNSYSAKVDYLYRPLTLKYGVCGIKIWTCK